MAIDMIKLVKRHKFYKNMPGFVYEHLKNSINFELDPAKEWKKAGYKSFDFLSSGQDDTYYYAMFLAVNNSDYVLFKSNNGPIVPFLILDFKIDRYIQMINNI
jgi:hypothetical protein